MRLFLMSFLVWLDASSFRQQKESRQLTPLIIARTVLLNGLLGVAFGWLYWKRGLAAMISHFSADVVLHVLPA